MSEAAAGAIVGGTFATFAIAAIAIYVLLIIAFWKIFVKAGEKGWKSLIPVYNLYLIFKMGWKTKFFWIALALMVIGGAVAGFCDPTAVTNTYASGAATASVTTYSAGYAIGELIAAIGGIFVYASWYFLGKSFGHGVGFFILTIFFFEFTMLYLGFSRDEYRGNLSK